MNKVCSFKDCGKPSVARALCRTHYSQWQRGKNLSEVVPAGQMTIKECEVENCGRKCYSNGLCQTHRKKQLEGKPLGKIREKRMEGYSCDYPFCKDNGVSFNLCNYHYRQYKAGKPLTPKPVRLSLEERFWAKVDKSGDCWNWIAGKYTQGYGKFSVGGKTYVAHRWVYERLVRPIAKGLVVDHVCRNPSCVRVEHLRVVTVAQNSQNSAATSACSGYRNVHKVTYPSGKIRWKVSLYYLGKRYSNGTYEDIDKAHVAAVELRNKIYTHNDMDND